MTRLGPILILYMSGTQVGKELPDLHTGHSPTESDIYHCIDTIDSPDDEHMVARSM